MQEDPAAATHKGRDPQKIEERVGVTMVGVDEDQLKLIASRELAHVRGIVRRVHAD